MKFATDLDDTERLRADLAGKELKSLVDKLVAIAHQLPDDIEHIVESEAFELNSEIITNKKNHANTSGALRISHVQVEADGLQSWENSRLKWRQLRHEKALKDFEAQIHSAEFTDPVERQHFMQQVRGGQSLRRQQLQKLLGQLGQLSAENITSERVHKVSAEFLALQEQEDRAVGSCHAGLEDLGIQHKARVAQRVEALRAELHAYGALQQEPDLAAISRSLSAAVTDPALAELFRVGGGLKSELEAQAADMLRADEVIYEALVGDMLWRLQQINAGFPLRGVMQERGRLGQLDKLRALVTKTRTAPRAEVAQVLRALLPELQDLAELPQLADDFRASLAAVAGEIAAELEALQQRASDSPTSHAPLVQSPTNASKTASLAGSSRRGGTKNMTHSSGTVATAATGGAYADPQLVKQWSRRLGILLFGCELPEEHQAACAAALQAVQQQRDCNALVDEAVHRQSDLPSRLLHLQWQHDADRFVGYLEAQAAGFSEVENNLVAFFLALARLVEEHRAKQKQLDDQVADELWDLAEEHRFEKEDNEADYEKACQRIREATKPEELQSHFEEVLQLLDKIQASYRTFHSRSCFAADKHPLLLLDEFCSYMRSLCGSLCLAPHKSHELLRRYDTQFDLVQRLNKSHFEADPLAAGVERRDFCELIRQDCAAPPPGHREEYQSPFLRRRSPGSGESFSGVFTLSLGLPQQLARFRKEGAFVPAAVPVPSEEAEKVPEAAPSAKEDAEAELQRQVEDALALNGRLKKAPHGSLPFLVADPPPGLLLPLPSEAQLAAMHPLERREQERLLLRGFLQLEEGQPALLALSQDPAALAEYQRVQRLAASTKRRLLQEAEHAWQLAHPPLRDQEPWLLALPLSDEELRPLLEGVRDSLVGAVERESFVRLAGADKETDRRKTELSDQLEDAIRNHWPRRGRVETQIKQPRDAELMSHKQKTWRLVQQVQQRVTDSRQRFLQVLDAARADCDRFVSDMAALRNSLGGDKFRNLAALQGVDAKARGLAMSFQASSAAALARLQQISQQESGAIRAAAQDFRRVCPPQEEAAGGYSQAELQEIQQIMDDQCGEIAAYAEEWAREQASLAEQQQQSLQCQGEFSERYRRSVQELSMSEGLGQRYGAPRRRAGERLHTEVTRDEQRAGAVDALLAQLEFLLSEAVRDGTLRWAGRRDSIPPGPECGEEGPGKEGGSATGVARQRLAEVQRAWQLLGLLRAALLQRVGYLRVADPDQLAALLAPCDPSLPPAPSPEPPPLPWLSEERLLALLGRLPLPSGPPTEAPATPSLQQLVEEVEAACRGETLQLFQAEGAPAALALPDSLQLWLADSRDRLLGRHGYRERAWQRLWGQVQRCEDLLGRRPAPQPSDEDQTSSQPQDPSPAGPALPAVCLRHLSEAYEDLAAKDKASRLKVPFPLNLTYPNPSDLDLGLLRAPAGVGAGPAEAREAAEAPPGLARRQGAAGAAGPGRVAALAGAVRARGPVPQPPESLAGGAAEALPAGPGPGSPRPAAAAGPRAPPGGPAAAPRHRPAAQAPDPQEAPQGPAAQGRGPGRPRGPLARSQLASPGHRGRSAGVSPGRGAGGRPGQRPRRPAPP